jgi:hypothetical protein
MDDATAEPADDAPPQDTLPDDRPPLEQRIATFLVRLAAVALAVVVVTGVPLVWAYEPGQTGGLRGLHSLASTLLLGAAGALLLTTAVAALRYRRRTWTGWAVAVVGFAGAAAGVFTGSLLAWESIGARAVSTGEDLRNGALAPLSDGVRFAIVGGTEISPGTYLLWLVVHVVVVTGALAAAGWLAWRRHAAAAEPTAVPGG